jgi:hypothetical protein
LYEQIQQDERPEELRGIMDRYYEWFKLLPSYSRADLTELSAVKRIEWITKRLQEEQTKITSEPPPGKGSDVLWSWMEDYAKRNETAFMDGLPERMRKNLSGMAPAERWRAVMRIMWFRPPGGQNRAFQISDGDLADLQSRFTPEIRKLLEAKPQGEQNRILQNWAQNLLRQKRGPGPGDLVDDKLLAEFFEKELTDQERERLISLSGEEMQRELLRLYIMRNRPPEMFPHRPDEFPPGPPGNEHDRDRHEP